MPRSRGKKRDFRTPEVRRKYEGSTGEYQEVRGIGDRTIRRRTICRGHFVADNSSHVNSLPDYCDELSMRRIVLRRIVLVPREYEEVRGSTKGVRGEYEGSTRGVRREYERSKKGVQGSTKKYGKYGSLAFSPLAQAHQSDTGPHRI